MSSPLRFAYVALLVAFCGFVYVLGATGRDDSHITFWAAHTLAHRGAILNYNGQAVEQSSSLFFTLVLAVAWWVSHLAPESVAPLLSCACGILTWILAARIARRLAPETEPWTLLFGATCLPVAYWSLSGMETTTASLLYVGFVLLTLQLLDGPRSIGRWARVFAVLACLMLVRPESPFVCIAALVLAATVSAVGPGRRSDARRLLVLVGSASGLFALVVVLRLFLFHLPFPLPVVAKVGTSSPHAKLDAIRSGYAYLVEPDNGFGIGPVLLACLVLYTGFVGVSWIRRRPIPPASLLCWSFGLALLGFVVSAGGDWMELGRFLVAAWPFALVLALACIWRLIDTRWLRTTLLSGMVCFQLASIPVFARQSSTGIPMWVPIAKSDAAWMEAHNGVHLRSLHFVEPLTRAIVDVSSQKNGQPVVVLTGEMGAIPYHVAARTSVPVRFIDRFGLATLDATSCSLTRALGRSTFGVRLTYAYYLDHVNELASSCDFPMPDIVFDLPMFLQPPLQRRLEALGYVFVYRQPREIFAAPWMLDEPERRTPVLAVRKLFTADRSDAIQRPRPASVRQGVQQRP